ncbi:carboxypeptidase regulatory-like domain-containing protein [Piscibacillus salipiscarius]|uniref:carboxypeptidase regulatory-like domain-containing protein n=1 Tax=Piscibacillus salipiscarius TaxID=299480 RepID=UPI0006CFA18A|nr:carboxypeptidase regulatory-like domain-containing protein [Piscibacillus salipiscarius]
MGYKPRTESSVELLLGGYGFTFSHDADDYTAEGKELLIDSIVWAAHAEFPTINGTVADQEGNPLDATVKVVGESFETTTNDNGEYSIALLEGDYEIEVESFGYESQTISASASHGNEPVNVKLEVHQEAGSISGVIENEQDGQAIQDVNINVDGIPRETTSNTQGAFNIDRMEPGEYTLTLTADGYVTKELNISINPGENLDLTIRMKPSPLVGIIVDNQSNDETLANYLEGRGFNTKELFYTDLDQLSDLDLVIANSDYNRDLEPTEEEFDRFLKAIDQEKLSVIWTGHVNGRGGIRFLHQYENNPQVEIRERDADKTIKPIAEHPITAGLEVNDTYSFESRSDYYYAFDEYDGHTVATVNHPTEGDLGDLAAYKGRTTDSVEVLLANTTFGYQFSPDEPRYFNETLVKLINNSILWTLDNEESLAADVNGVINNDLGTQIAGTVTVKETGKIIESNADGEFFLGLQEGTYTLEIEAFGHQTGEFSITVENGEVYNETFTIQSNDIGTLSGQILDGETEEPISGATVNILGTPASVETDENGEFELTLPIGSYDLQVMAEGYMTTTETNIDIKHNETTDVSVFMPYSEKVAVITMSSRFDEFESVMTNAGYDADYINYTDLDEFISEIPNYALIIYNNHSYYTSDELFTDFIEKTDEHEVSVIFASQYGGGTIGDLSDLLGDPADVEHGFVPGHINIKTMQDHPLFAGIQDEEFRILDDGDNNQQYAIYEDYSGTTIGSISHDQEGVIGDGIGYDFRTANSVHLLLSGFQIGSYSDPTSNWTDEAHIFYQNAMNWALNASIGEIRGTVTDVNDEPIANATVSIPGLDIETTTNANGEYQIGIGTGTYDVSVSARGYHEDTKSVTVESQGHSAELNFTLEAIEGQPITGQVMDAENEGTLSGATVELYIGDETEPIETVETSEDGQFNFDQLLPDDYVLKIKRDGYLNKTIETVLGDKPITVDVLLNDIKVAVVGDFKNKLQTLLNDHDLYAEGRDWDVAQDVTEYDLIILNSSEGNPEQLQELIDATDEHDVSLAFLGTWGANRGSIPTLKDTVGYPERGDDGYDEGEVILNVSDSEHPIFEGLPDEMTIHSEKSPYSAFVNYPGHQLGDLQVDGETKGTAVAYSYRSQQSVHLLLSSFAVNNMIGPGYGWTEDGQALFVQAMDYALNAEQEPPSTPAWDQKRLKN